MTPRRTTAPRGGHTHQDGHRSILDRVGDVIGNSAAYVAHEVMPDIGAKLVDEAWFDRRPAYAGTSFDPPSAVSERSEGHSGDPHTPADPGHAAEQDVTHDHDR